MDSPDDTLEPNPRLRCIIGTRGVEICVSRPDVASTIGRRYLWMAASKRCMKSPKDFFMTFIIGFKVIRFDMGVKYIM